MQTIRQATFQVCQVHAATMQQAFAAARTSGSRCNCASSAAQIIREQQSWIRRFGSHVASQAQSARSMCSSTLLFPIPTLTGLQSVCSACPYKSFSRSHLGFRFAPRFRFGTGLGCGTLGRRRSTLNGLEIFQEFHVVRSMGQAGGLLC